MLKPPLFPPSLCIKCPTGAQHLERNNSREPEEREGAKVASVNLEVTYRPHRAHVVHSRVQARLHSPTAASATDGRRWWRGGGVAGDAKVKTSPMSAWRCKGRWHCGKRMLGEGGSTGRAASLAEDEHAGGAGRGVDGAHLVGDVGARDQRHPAGHAGPRHRRVQPRRQQRHHHVCRSHLRARNASWFCFFSRLLVHELRNGAFQ